MPNISLLYLILLYRYCTSYVQEEEVSEEMLTFHEVVNHMQEQEEEVIDSHREIIEVFVLCYIIDIMSAFKLH